MPQYAGTTHKSTLLTNISQRVKVGGLQNDRLFPPRNVTKDTDEYVVYEAKDIQTLQDLNLDVWADRAAVNEIELRHSTDTYSLGYYGLKDCITERAENNQDAPINLQSDSAEHLSEQLLLRREKRGLDILALNTNWTSVDLATGAGWDNTDYATSDPYTVIETAVLAIKNAIGIRPNTIAMDLEAQFGLARHPDTLDFVHGTGGAVDEDMLARILRSKYRLELVPIDAIQNTANIAQASNVVSLFSDKVWIGFVNPSPGLKSLTATAMFQRVFGQDRMPTSRWYDNDRDGWIIRPKLAYGHKVVTAAAGYLIEDVLAPTG